jgi:hypothetical protein
MRKPAARSVRSKFNQRTSSQTPNQARPFELLEDRRLFSVLAHYYNDGFWGNGNAGRPAAPYNINGGTVAFPNQTISVARAGDVQTTVPNIDFDWGGGSPDPAIRGDNHSTLFVGKLVAPATGTYEILGYGDDDTHVFVDGQLVSSDPLGHGQEDPRSAGSLGHGGGAATIDLTAGQQYDLVVLQAEQGGGSGVRLRWVLPGGDSANPVVVPAANLVETVTPVTAPTGLSRDAAEQYGVKINFTDTSKSELRYDLQRRTAGGTFATVASGNINDNSITDYSARPGVAYEYRVVAWNLQGEAASATSVPATLTLPAATAGAQGYYFNDQWWKAGAPAATNGTAVIVGPNPDFSENVGDVVEDYSDGNNGTPGSPEPGVIRPDNHSTLFTGRITAPETGEYQILGFTDDDSYLWVNGQLVSADPGGHGVPGVVTDIDIRNPITLTAGQSYDFVLVQSEGGGGSAAILRWVTPSQAAGGDTTPVNIPADVFTSNQAAVPLAPTALTPVATDATVVRLTWSDNSKGEVRYRVERSTSADFSTGLTSVLLPINATTYQDAGLARGTQYFYRVTAENFTGSASATANVTTPAVGPVPAAPSNLVAYNLFGNRNFIQFTDNSVNEAGFVIERRPASGGTFTAVAASPIPGNAAGTSGGTISFYDTDGVVTGQNYVYRVRARNADNVDSANSNEATTVLAGLKATYIDSTSPFASRGFYNDVSNTTDPLVRGEPNVDVDWGTGSPATSIGVDTFEANFEGQIQIDTAGSYTFYGTSDDGIRVFVDGQLVVDAWVDRGPTETAGTPIDLTAGKHEIRVQYYENGGGAMVRLGYESTDAGVAKQTVPASKLTPTTGTEALRAPIQLTATAGVGNSIVVSYVDTSASETGFQVQRSSTGPDGGFATIATLPADQSVFIDNGATDPGTTYYYRVIATGAAGATQTSEATTGTNPAAAVGAAVNFSDFAATDTQNQFAINGSGSFFDGDTDPATTERLRLTNATNDQRTSAYLTTPYDISKGFQGSFDFVVGGPGNQSGNPADGFTFVLQAATTQGVPVGTTAIGDGGGGLAYSTGLNNSVALKFDIYNNLNQTGLYVNGNGISDDPADPRNRVIPANLDINSGQRLHVTFSYDPTTKTLTQTIDDINNPATAPFSTTYTVDIPYTIGSAAAYVGFTGATGGENASQDILNFAFNPTAPAAGGAISELYVRGSTWTGAFKSYMAGQGLGDANLGYRVDNKAANDVVPWINVDEIVLRYGTPPTGSGVPVAGSVVLDGVRGDYTLSSVTQLDPQTFVLRLDRALGNLTAGGNNGDRIALTVQGAGPAGGAYTRTINVLQGDTDKNGSVVANDFSDVKKKFFRSTTAPGPAGDTQYTVFHDVDGNGSIIANDFSEVKSRFFDNLPPAPAAEISPAALPVSAPRWANVFSANQAPAMANTAARSFFFIMVGRRFYRDGRSTQPVVLATARERGYASTRFAPNRSAVIEAAATPDAAGAAGRLSKKRLFTSEKSLATMVPLPSTSWNTV